MAFSIEFSSLIYATFPYILLPELSLHPLRYTGIAIAGSIIVLVQVAITYFADISSTSDIWILVDNLSQIINDCCWEVIFFYSSISILDVYPPLFLVMICHSNITARSFPFFWLFDDSAWQDTLTGKLETNIFFISVWNNILVFMFTFSSLSWLQS